MNAQKPASGWLFSESVSTRRRECGHGDIDVWHYSEINIAKQLKHVYQRPWQELAVQGPTHVRTFCVASSLYYWFFFFMGPLFGRGNVVVLVGTRGPKVVRASTSAESADKMLVSCHCFPPPIKYHIFVLLEAIRSCSCSPLHATFPRLLLQAGLPVQVTQPSLILRGESHWRQQLRSP